MKNSRLNITAMVSIYNEQDIIAEVIENFLGNGLNVVALDNGSTDNSYSICQELAQQRGFTLQRWQPEGLDLEQLTLRLYRMAVEHAPDWLIFSDGDEIMQTGQSGRTIRDAIEKANSGGYNVMQFNRYDFFMSDSDDLTVASPLQRLRYYSWQGDFNYRAFSHVPGIRACPSFAHYPLFPPQIRYQVAPEKLVLRHYPYRSQQHATNKIANMVRKIEADVGGLKSWQSRYLRIASEGRYLDAADHRLLTYYNNDDNWNTERSFAPFTDIQLTADQIFSPEGLLKHRPAPTVDWETGLPDKALQSRITT